MLVFLINFLAVPRIVGSLASFKAILEAKSLEIVVSKLSLISISWADEWLLIAVAIIWLLANGAVSDKEKKERAKKDIMAYTANNGIV